MPFSRCAPGGLARDRASNGWVSVGPDGTAYASALTFTPYPLAGGGIGESAGLAVSVSRDGGRSWGAPVLVAANSADKDAITADPVRGRTAYLVWNGAAASGGGLVFSKTLDGGKNWSEPVLISPDNTRQSSLGGEILVSPRTGALLVVHELTYTRFTSGSAVPHGTDAWEAVSASTDGGRTWTTRKIAELRPMGPLHSGGSILVSPLREAGGMPSSAIDPASGRIYAVWEDARFSKGKRADVVISVSSDGGRRWGAPRLVNPTDSMREFDPQIAVNADGMVGVTYYAMRNLKGANQPLPTRYVFQSSSDHGAHFGKSRALFGPFDMRLMPRVGGYFVGDYVGLTAVGKQFVSLFVTPAADDAPGKTSIVSVRVSP